MICPNCKNEIPEGSIYCEHCGQTIQIVPDYNALDDVLPAMVGKKQPTGASANQNTTAAKLSADTQEFKRKRLMIWSAVVITLTVFIAAFLTWQCYIRSYGYYMSRGAACDEAKEYKDANGYYEMAIAANKTAEACFAYGQNAYRMGDYETAEQYLLDAIALDDGYADAYVILCKIYEANRDYVSIEALATYTSDKEILAMIDASLILPPSFSIIGGRYDDDVLLYLTAPKGVEIYYTVDGTAPEDGLLYDDEKGILITDGTTKVRAICKNEEGKFGFETEEVYRITYKAPDYPTVTPSNGTFREATYITISPQKEGDRVYYTWDGSTPTVDSAQYTEPILIPEGNNILSIIVINDHDLISEVLQCNYIYRP